MGGRGKGDEEQLWLGGGIVTDRDFQFAIPLDQYTASGAGDAFKDGLTSVRPDVKLSKKDAIKLAHGLLATGILIGGTGSLRTRLYKAARMIGNYEALMKGQKAIVTRFARIMTGKITGQTFRKIFKQ
jgi:hypothetical protein